MTGDNNGAAPISVDSNMTLMTCYYGANRFEGKFIGIASDTESFKSADPARLMPGTSFTFHDTCSVPNDKKELAGRVDH